MVDHPHGKPHPFCLTLHSCKTLLSVPPCQQTTYQEAVLLQLIQTGVHRDILYLLNLHTLKKSTTTAQFHHTTLFLSLDIYTETTFPHITTECFKLEA